MQSFNGMTIFLWLLMLFKWLLLSWFLPVLLFLFLLLMTDVLDDEDNDRDDEDDEFFNAFGLKIKA